MDEQSQHLHLLRNGELIDAVITQAPLSDDQPEGCALELAYRGRRLRAYGTDQFDALIALRGALEIDGLYLNLPGQSAPVR